MELLIIYDIVVTHSWFITSFKVIRLSGSDYNSLEINDFKVYDKDSFNCKPFDI
jgi:hypothetical protein